MKTETKVGVLVVAFIATLIFFTFKIGGDRFPWQKEEGYHLYVLFDSTSGLEKKALVRYAGVEVGMVDDISLEGGKAKVSIVLRPDVEVRDNAVFEIGSMGLMGEKFVNIKGGTKRARLLENGDVIEGIAPISIDQLMASVNAISQDVKAITASVRAAVGEKDQDNRIESIVKNVDRLAKILADTMEQNDENLTATVANFKAISQELRYIITENRSNIDGSLANFHTATGDLANALPQILDNLSDITADLRVLIRQNQANLDSTIKNIADSSEHLDSAMNDIRHIVAKVEKGEGSLGKIIGSDEFHDNLNTALKDIDKASNEFRSFFGHVSDYRIFVGYRGEYLSGEDAMKNYVSLKIKPRPDKYYLLELVSSPSGKYFEKEYHIHFDDVPDGEPEDLNFTMEKWEKNELTFNLQMAKVYGRWTIRGGLIESTGGFGLDVDFFRRALRLSVEGWDFSRDSDPHLKIGGRLNLTENFYLTGGWDDPLLRKDDLDSIYFGAGLMLEDEDFKFLLGFLPMMSGS